MTAGQAKTLIIIAAVFGVFGLVTATYISEFVGVIVMVFAIVASQFAVAAYENRDKQV